MRNLFKITCIIALCMIAAGKMNAQPESWVCNAHDWQYDQSLYVSLSLDDEDIANSTYGDYVVSAWYGSECRGVSEVISLGSNGYALNIRLRSNKESGEELTFKVYKTSEQKTLTTSTKVDFQNNKSDGIGSMPSNPLKLECVSATPGDVDGDGEIDLTDAQYIFDFYLGEEVPDDFNEAAADFDGDGSVDLTDAQLVFEYYLNGE